MSPKHQYRGKRQGGRGGRGGDRGGSGGGGANSNNRGSQQFVSRALSWALRHNAADLGLRMTSDGYCPVQDIVSHSYKKLAKITSLDEQIRPVVETNDKQRFRLELRPARLYQQQPTQRDGETLPWAVIPLTEDQAAPVAESVMAQYNSTLAAAAATTNDDEDGSADQSPSSTYLIWCIRANQGHSIQGINPEFLLKQLSTDELAATPTIVHGTYFDAWNKIQSSGGLSRMNRTHIHCASGLLNSKDENGETAIISGMRKSCQVHIYISGARCAKEEIRFFRSDNGVLLTAGEDDKGILPLKFVSHVTDQHGKVLFDQRDEN